MPKVAIYCRLSEEDRDKQSETDDSNSIQNQKTMLMQYSMEQGWEVFNIYSDDDYTGSDRNRPEFKRLLQDAERHRFDIVLCKTQSRFTRELELVEKYLHGLFPVWGVRFVSIVDNADTANKGNKKSRQINGLVNEWYLEDMSESIRSVLDNRRRNGLHIGAFALYGYRKDPEKKGHLIIDEEAAAVVREVFTLFSQGYGKTAIARMLNDRGIPNPTEYKRLHGLRYQQPERKTSTLWRYSAISDMLTNEIYIGNMVQGKYGSESYKTKRNRPRPRDEWYWVEGTHTPIIQRELWDRVQAIVAQRAKPFRTGSVGLFAQKVRCAHCGCTMRSSKSHGRYYLQCATRHMAKDACTGAFISVELLEKMVTAELRRLSREYLDMDRLARNIPLCNNLQAEKKRLENDMTVYRRRIAEYVKGRRDLYLDKVRGLISESDYWDMAKEFSKNQTQLEQNLLEGQNRVKELEAQMASGDSRQALAEQYTTPEHLTREMVEVLVDYIVVEKREKGCPCPTVEIHWNF